MFAAAPIYLYLPRFVAFARAMFSLGLCLKNPILELLLAETLTLDSSDSSISIQFNAIVYLFV